MAETSTIEWTDATWNPVTGCSVVSPGCTNCYAMRLAGGRLQHHPSRQGLTSPSRAGPVWNGRVRLNEDWLDQPLRWRRPRRIFVCAHGDLFHESVPDEWIDRVFAVMALSPQHQFQVLTKRAERMRDYMRSLYGGLGLNFDRLSGHAVQVSGSPCAAGSIEDCDLPLPNVWLGVSAEDQARADQRIPHLLETPAAVRFLSAEPLLGPIDLERVWARMPSGGQALRNALQACEYDQDARARLDWVIAGGESGAGARPMHVAWPRRLRDQCRAAGVPFFFKQWGHWVAGERLGSSWYHYQNGTATPHVDRHLVGSPMLAVGKAAAGRHLDGGTWDEMPSIEGEP